jgi:hypothetical protein
MKGMKDSEETKVGRKTDKLGEKVEKEPEVRRKEVEKGI